MVFSGQPSSKIITSVRKEFRQLEWDADLVDDCKRLVELAVREDLGRYLDWTTLALVSSQARGSASLVSRESGVIAGIRAVRVILETMQCSVEFRNRLEDGTKVEPGTELGRLSGSVRDLLTAERIILNFVSHLSGIATLARRYVDRIAGTPARIYDTRKTIPGFRRLEKYAVRCGGAHNHRLGLHEAILIKDNHLAFGGGETRLFTPAEAVRRARDFLQETLPADHAESMIVEIEVDTLVQLEQVLTAAPDIVLLDNMSNDQLRQAVELRNARQTAIELEASGGVNLENVRSIAETGVDRISVGELTHSARCLDIGLDWS
jgi:nicotinate-nucleotide pyrophosphorylase (carboxylating)